MDTVEGENHELGASATSSVEPANISRVAELSQTLHSRLDYMIRYLELDSSRIVPSLKRTAILERVKSTQTWQQRALGANEAQDKIVELDRFMTELLQRTWSNDDVRNLSTKVVAEWARMQIIFFHLCESTGVWNHISRVWKKEMASKYQEHHIHYTFFCNGKGQNINNIMYIISFLTLGWLNVSRISYTLYGFSQWNICIPHCIFCIGKVIRD